MTLKTSRKHEVPDTYFQLVKRFPLIRIRNDEHLVAAQRVIDQLLQKELDEGAQDYLDVLTDLVQAYEEEHEPIPDASEADVLRELMAARGLKQQALAKGVGIVQSGISSVLSGSRSLTKDQVERLAKYFHVSPAAFFPSGANK